jgi:hypothetical protein
MDSRTENQVVDETPTKWDEREDSSADRVKGHTLEIEKELGTIAKAIKKEQQGKISFTKEEQKRILEASGTIRANVMQLLLEVIAAQQAQKRAEERAARQEEQLEKLKKQLKQAEESGKGAKSQVSVVTRGMQTEGAAGKKGQPQAKQTPKEVQARETAQTRKEAGSKGEEKKTKEGQPKKANPKEGSWQIVSYAAKLKAKVPVKEETTVKMPGKSAEEVKAKLVRTLDIEKIGGPLSQVIPTKRGEVVLVCRNEEQRKKLETVLKTTEGVEMGSKKKLNPTVTLTGLETGWKEEEIVDEVFQKNGWIQSTTTREEFKEAFKFLARKRCQKSPKENLTFAVEPRLHKAFIEKQKIVVGLTMVFVEEMVQVTRCFKCNGLGHIAKSCKQEPKCHKCGKEGHKIKECRSEKSECGNCRQAGHRAYDRKCPTMKRALEWKIARTARC